ncbi:MAG: hypothetical protein VB934_01150 [Polyangiaceae bacterium]
MNDQEKAKFARQAMEAAALLNPGKITERVKDSVAGAAGSAALRGLAAIGRLTGRDTERSPARQRAAEEVDVNRVFAAIDASETAEFEQQLRVAVARKAQEDQARQEDTRRLDLAELRGSFPESARELALLLFNCVDLLEELSGDAEGRPASAAELERKEQLLMRIAQLLAPTASEAILSFVGHVVQTSRRYRSD